MSTIAATTTTPSRGTIVAREYHDIQQAIVAGKDHFSINVGGVDRDVTVLAALGKHPSRFGPKSDTDHYTTIKVHDQNHDGSGGETTTFTLSSADGVDNMIQKRTVDASGNSSDVTLVYAAGGLDGSGPQGWIMSSGDQ